MQCENELRLIPKEYVCANGVRLLFRLLFLETFELP